VNCKRLDKVFPIKYLIRVINVIARVVSMIIVK
jgi:hypothetical protein